MKFITEYLHFRLFGLRRQLRQQLFARPTIDRKSAFVALKCNFHTSKPEIIQHKCLRRRFHFQHLFIFACQWVWIETRKRARPFFSSPVFVVSTVREPMNSFAVDNIKCGQSNAWNDEIDARKWQIKTQILSSRPQQRLLISIKLRTRINGARRMEMFSTRIAQALSCILWITLMCFCFHLLSNALVSTFRAFTEKDTHVRSKQIEFSLSWGVKNRRFHVSCVNWKEKKSLKQNNRFQMSIRSTKNNAFYVCSKAFHRQRGKFKLPHFVPS